MRAPPPGDMAATRLMEPQKPLTLSTAEQDAALDAFDLYAAGIDRDPEPWMHPAAAALGAALVPVLGAAR